MLFNNGKECRPSDLQAPKAQQLVAYLISGQNPYVSLVECRKSPARDIVCVEVCPEVSQLKKYDIKPREILAIHFDSEDVDVPRVYALREDFPRNVPHRILEYEGYPISLCLYEERYRDIKALWTPARFLERIRGWLQDTAQGTLHKEDQPLEPLLFNSGTYIIISEEILKSETSERLSVVDCSGGEGGKSALRVVKAKEKTPDILRITAIKIQLPPQEHGVVSHTPRSLWELHELFQKAEFDLLGHLRTEMKKWEITNEVRDSTFAIFGYFPKKRSSDADPETSDMWVFASPKKVYEVLEDIGVFAGHSAIGKLKVPLLGGKLDESKRGENTPIELLNPVFELTRERAAILNGYDEAKEIAILAIGSGSLGAQVTMNCSRAGFGTWTIVEDDILLPHNMARHALDGFFLGRSKAGALQAAINKTINCPLVVDAIQADFIQPGKNKDILDAALLKTSVILDMSASLSVARHVTHDVESSARRISAFLAPSGKDLVILAESGDRTLRLDDLEMQYYKELCHNPKLTNHLKVTGKTRYANTCRDVSSRIPHDFIMLHAAVASRSIKTILDADAAGIQIFSAEDNMQVSLIQPNNENVTEIGVGEWKLRISDYATKQFLSLRADKLPKETGGVIIGAFDVQHRIIYVVDVLSAPADSQEYPTAFIRGHSGLLTQVKSIQDKTAGNLTYVGEWHSHPDKAKCWPSSDDAKVIEWIEEHMVMDGLPSVMLIAGKNEICFCVGKEAVTREFKYVRK